MALKDLQEFAIELAVKRPSQTFQQPFSVAFGTPEGSFVLRDKDGREYHRIVAQLRRAMGERMSKGSITSLAQTVILKTVDQKKKNQRTPIEQRAEEAVKEARLALTAPNLTWVNCIPIRGFAPPKKAWTLNDVKSIDIERAEGVKLMKKTRCITSTLQHVKEFKAASNAQLRKTLIEDHKGQAFALVTTDALDAEAAWTTAKRRLRDTLACLNFAIESLYGSSQHYELTDDEPKTRHFATGITLNVTDHNLFVGQSEMTAATGIIEPEKLRKDMQRHPALRYLLQYLRATKLKKHEERVMSALQWAGRAAVERKPEEAFLFRAIALESLILRGGDNAGLTDRLAYFIVHLLGKGLNNRYESYRQIKRLYGVRSSIVHTGKLEVDDDEASLLRSYIRHCFMEVLYHKEFRKMNSEEELTEWFKARMRGDK
jgi:hypothetical protein